MCNFFNYSKLFQEKVYKEQLEIFGDDKETAVTYNQLQEMRYLEQFIKEVLRFYPPVPFFARLNDKDRTYRKYFN